LLESFQLFLSSCKLNSFIISAVTQSGQWRLSHGGIFSSLYNVRRPIFSALRCQQKFRSRDQRESLSRVMLSKSYYVKFSKESCELVSWDIIGCGGWNCAFIIIIGNVYFAKDEVSRDEVCRQEAAKLKGCEAKKSRGR